ncbi:NAD(P)/FAD-dependent oxidoreductase [Natronorarus salvus]|uniref:NAD(P)/FAD-dependent oxidoreductase n=1 Tax=Natronorarus salvus TaxID=3117733 RepID=UPI002F268F0C
MDVAIVGGGIVGLASAYELARHDCAVTVFEKGSLGMGSTARAAGGIRKQFSTRVNVELSLASIPTWDSFEERFGVDIAFRRHGYLFLAREGATEETLRENVSMQNDLGVPSELLSPEEARGHCPGLRADRFRACSYCASDGIADPNLAVQGYAQAVREAGVEVRTKTAVTELLTEDGRVTGLVADGEHVDADRVVLAAGAWSRKLARSVDLDLPIAPRRRSIAVVDPESPVPETDPLTADLDTGAYFLPEREGIAFVGGQIGEDPDVDPDSYGEGIEMLWAAEAVERAGDLATYFGPDSRIRRGWSGLYAVTPDSYPVIEESLPGLITAAGFSGHGFMHAPATGTIVSELVTEREAATVDIAPLSSDRFEEDVRAERNVV